MHRHGYKGRKFGREADQRRALLRGLAVSLIQHGSIETTLPKAKELRPFIEKLTTKARTADLHQRRQLIARLNSVAAAHTLCDQIAPRLQRSSGYTRIERTGFRVGDSSPLARISFVDDVTALEEEAPKPVEAAKSTVKARATKPKITNKKEAVAA